MHKLLENYILHDTAPTGNPFTVAMAKQIITKGLVRMDEVWGVEVPLYADGLYAGTTDLIGVHTGSDAIVDFKNARSKRKPEWVEDYGIQTAAYAMAHNEMFGTSIKKGVVMLCTHDAEYQEFVFEGKDFEIATSKWLQRLEEYYAKQ
jgi:genome maintenance exonuclease 1